MQKFVLLFLLLPLGFFLEVCSSSLLPAHPYDTKQERRSLCEVCVLGKCSNPSAPGQGSFHHAAKTWMTGQDIYGHLSHCNSPHACKHRP